MGAVLSLIVKLIIKLFGKKADAACLTMLDVTPEIVPNNLPSETRWVIVLIGMESPSA